MRREKKIVSILKLYYIVMSNDPLLQASASGYGRMKYCGRFSKATANPSTNGLLTERKANLVS
jgi:hypothetical protein